MLDLIVRQLPLRDRVIQRFSPDEFQPNDPPACVDTEEAWNERESLQPEQCRGFQVKLPAKSALNPVTNTGLAVSRRPFLDAYDSVAKYKHKGPMAPRNLPPPSIEEGCISWIACEYKSFLVDFTQNPVLQLP